MRPIDCVSSRPRWFHVLPPSVVPQTPSPIDELCRLFDSPDGGDRRAHAWTPVPEVYPLSLHDALPISYLPGPDGSTSCRHPWCPRPRRRSTNSAGCWTPRMAAIGGHTPGLPSPRSTLFPYTTLFRSRIFQAQMVPRLAAIRGAPDPVADRRTLPVVGLPGWRRSESTRLNSSHPCI